MADYLFGVVAAEMPASFESGALQAQAVAARTYMRYKMLHPTGAHPDADMCDDITSGASNDLERATKMAREMVTRLGMSEELGTQVFGEAQHQVFLGRDYADHQDYSEETARRIDAEVQRIMREAHRRAEAILSARRDQLDLMASVLLERETVEGEAVEALLNNEWASYLERTGAAASADAQASAKPKLSQEELEEDAARYAEAAIAAEAAVEAEAARGATADDKAAADGAVMDPTGDAAGTEEASNRES